MKENFLHLLSEVECIVNINGTYIGNIDNSTHHELDVITNTKYIYITYEPISQKANALPYTFVLNTEATPVTDNEYIKVVPFPNNNYDIIMKPFYYYQISESNILFNGSVGKFFVSILSDTATHITIFSGASVIFTTNVIPLKEARVKQQKDFIIIEGVVDEQTYHLLVIDTADFSIIQNETVQSIEETSEYICSYKKTNSICKHAKVWKLNFSNKSGEQYYVYEEEKQRTEVPQILIPFAFLQCVSVGDESSAKSFLSNSYTTATISQFQGYFGDIKEIFLNRHNVIPAKQNYTIMSNKMRNYNFVMDKNKIIDIEEVF